MRTSKTRNTARRQTTGKKRITCWACETHSLLPWVLPFSAGNSLLL